MEKDRITMKDTIAKAIRTVTVPPILATAMLLIFRFAYGNEFVTIPVLILEILFLVVVPVSAYPLSNLKKEEGKNAREQQRKLAFIMNFSGYALALLAGIINRCSQMLRIILTGYFIAVVVLTVINKIFKIRASGHACSCVLPYLFFCYWFGMKAAIICILLYLAEFWASIRLKRHTVQEFLLGSVVAVIIFILLILIF